VSDKTYLTLTDDHGIAVWLVSEDGRTAWLRFDRPDYFTNASPHLSALECEALITALYQFIRDVDGTPTTEPLREPAFSERGFADFGEFTDIEGERVRIVESSAVGTPRCWLASGGPTGGKIVPAPHPHLDAEMAWQLIERLGAFVAHVSGDDYWRNTEAYRAVWGAP
jgi:hypothetical protein